MSLKGKTITVQFTIPITVVEGWDSEEDLRSWVDNKCWEALVEHSNNEVLLGATMTTIIKGENNGS